MKLCGLFLLLTVVPVKAVEPTVSAEAVECFEWFGTLGFPDVKEVRFAEIWSGVVRPNVEGPQEMEMFTGFARVLDEKKMTVVTRDLVHGELSFGATSGRVSVSHVLVEKPFLEHVKRELATLPETGDGTRPNFGSTLGRKGEIFFLAYVCWRRGENEWAAKAFEAAKALRPQRLAGDTRQRTMRQELEREFGNQAMWEAVLRMRGARFAPAARTCWTIRRETLPRTSLAAIFERIPELYPECDYTARAVATAKVLRLMADEDARHVAVTDEEVANLPVEEQVREWLFQLRDLSEDQWGEPGGVDIFGLESGSAGTDSSPVHRLLRIGHAAVPQLIEAITDPRFTRSVECGRSFFFSHRALTVGDCALRILQRISGRQFHPLPGKGELTERESLEAMQQEARHWWTDIQEKGEKQSLIEGIAAGTQEPNELLAKLRALDPEAVEAALLAGAAKATHPGIQRGYIRAMGELRSAAIRKYLLGAARTGDPSPVRSIAVKVLSDHDDPEAEVLLINLWREIRKGGHQALSDAFKPALEMLCAVGTVECINALAAEWEGCCPAAKFEVVQELGLWFGPKRKQERHWAPKPRELQEGAREAVEGLLVRALEDREAYGGFVSEAGFGYHEPRICDLALHSLRLIKPDRYVFSNKAGRHQRNVERVIAMNGWRAAHDQSLLPLPERHLPILEEDEALRIVEVTVEGRVDEALQRILDAQGSRLKPGMVTDLLREMVEGKEFAALTIDVVRESDMRGAQVYVRTTPSAKEGEVGNFSLQWSACADDRRIGGSGRSGTLETASDNRYWTSLEESIGKILTQPAKVSLILRARLSVDIWR